MQFSQYIKCIAGEVDGESLDEAQSQALFAAMLDGGVPDLELGALLLALRGRTESSAELLGFLRAADERLYGLRPPAPRLRPVVFPAYGGTRLEHNCLPLLGLLLRRLGVPVLFHGTLEGGGISTVYVLRELGMLPCTSLSQTQKALDDDLLAFVPVAVLCPGLANLLALRSQLGVRSSAHLVVKLLAPFHGEEVRVVGAAAEPYLERLAAVLGLAGAHALLLRSTDGDPFANPRHRPRIEHHADGERSVLFDEETGPAKAAPGLPASVDAHATAAWTRQALAGETPIPHPLVNQLACCLYASGYTDDMNQAKAIAAVEAGTLGPASRHRGGPGRTSRMVMN